MTDSIKQSNLNPWVIGVAGGSGSGKTYFANDLMSALGPELCATVYQDNFYIDQSKRFDFDGGSVNFDHPSSLDFELLAKCISQLKRGEPTQIPIYDFATHQRKNETLLVPPRPIVLVDGILIFHSEAVRALLDDLIYFDAPESLRFQRRLERDVKERGRTPEGVKKQFQLQVKPMHDQYVEPSQKFAKKIVRSDEAYRKILMQSLAELKEKIK